MSKNVLLFVPGDANCDLLMKLMSNIGLMGYFYQVSILNEPRYASFKVPTIILGGQNKGVFTGLEAFNWVAKMKEWKHNQEIKKMGESQNQTINATISNLQGGVSLMGYSASEMGETPDNFSYMTTDDAIPKMYASSALPEKFNMFTPKEQKLAPNDAVKIAKQIDSDRKMFDDQYKAKLQDYINTRN